MLDEAENNVRGETKHLVPPENGVQPTKTLVSEDLAEVLCDRCNLELIDNPASNDEIGAITEKFDDLGDVELGLDAGPLKVSLGQKTSRAIFETPVGKLIIGLVVVASGISPLLNSIANVYPDDPVNNQTSHVTVTNNITNNYQYASAAERAPAAGDGGPLRWGNIIGRYNDSYIRELQRKNRTASDLRQLLQPLKYRVGDVMHEVRGGGPLSEAEQIERDVAAHALFFALTTERIKSQLSPRHAEHISSLVAESFASTLGKQNLPTLLAITGNLELGAKGEVTYRDIHRALHLTEGLASEIVQQRRDKHWVDLEQDADNQPFKIKVAQ